METRIVDINKVLPNPTNPRIIKDAKFKKLVKSIKEFPQMLDLRPIVVNKDMIALGGNMRLKAAIEAGLEEIPVISADELTPAQQEEFIIKDNLGYGEWDWDLLLTEWDTKLLDDWGLDTSKEKTSQQKLEASKAKLSELYVVPPFTILDARQGTWQDRKKAWKELIGEDGESREGTLSSGNSKAFQNTVSILDPVLSEISCRWFLPEGDDLKILDPFAGDTVFGYVSSYLKHTFTGIELRPEQVELNNIRVKEVNPKSLYICDDGQNVAKHIEPNTQDLIFSCPPYFDLEVYSDDPNDASNQETYEDFIQILDNAFTAAIGTLKENRFAVIVVGDLRDEKGSLRNFHEDIKSIFRRNGMPLYNELILVDPIGNASQRANYIMRRRKMTKTHQNVLVFHKPLKDPGLEESYTKVLVFINGNEDQVPNDFKQLTTLDVELNIDKPTK